MQCAYAHEFGRTTSKQLATTPHMPCLHLNSLKTVCGYVQPAAHSSLLKLTMPLFYILSLQVT